MKNVRKIFSYMTYLLPTGLIVPIISGPLKWKKWIVGAAAGKGKGLSIIINQSEQAQVHEALKLLKHDSICFDIGTNVGFYTLLFSEYAKQVYSFEPLPRNLQYLIRMVKINNIHNVKILPCAVSDSSHIGSFSEDHNPAMGKLSKNGSLPVLVITCDQFLLETKVSPDVIKIDVEGAELKVLKGASGLLRRAHPSILLSIHSDELRTDCLIFLKNIGYKKIIPINSSEIKEATEFAIVYDYTE